MATITKAATGTVLTTGTSWTGGVTPGASDIAQWISTSLGGTLTGNLNISGFEIAGAASAPTLSGSHTVGSSGFTFTSTNNRTFTFSGTITVGSSPGSWSLYNSTTSSAGGGSSLVITSTGNLSGSGSLVISRTTGSDIEFFNIQRTVTLFTGTITLNDGVGLVCGAATTGFSGATGIILNGGRITANTNTTFTCPITVNANSIMGFPLTANGSFTSGSNITFNAGAYTLTFNTANYILSGTIDLTSGNHSIIVNGSGTTMSGTLNLGNSGVSNVINAGTSNLTISGTLNAGTGSHTIGTTSTGALTISGLANLSTGSHTFTSVGDITTISDGLTGSNGFTVTGTSGNLSTVLTNITGTQKAISGNVTISSGTLVVGNTTSANGNMLPSINNFNITSATAALDYRTNTSYTFDRPVSGNGILRFFSYGASDPITTVADNLLDSFTGKMVIRSTSDTTAPILTSRVALSQFPSSIEFDLNPGAAGGFSYAEIIYNKAASTTANVTFVINQNNDAGSSSAFIQNSQSSSSHNLKLTGGISGTNGSGGAIASTVYFRLTGSNVGDNEFSGVISSGISRIYKEGIGKWILSGANTFPGSVEIRDGGTLVAKTNSALGVPNTNADNLNITENSVLELDGSSSNLTITNTIASSFINGTLRSSAGDNTFNSSAQNDGTIIYDVTAGSLNISNNITGTSARIIEKIGNSTLKLTRAAGAGYLGLFYIYSGEVQVTLLANSGAASSLGTQATAQSSILLGDTAGVTHPSGAAGFSSSATLTHTGTTADSTNRNIVCRADSGLDITINSSGTGSGSLNLTSGGTISFTTAGNHSINFGGTNSATNICNRTIPDTTGSGVVSISKAGTNTWTLSGAVSATGSLSCSAGTINLTNATLSCTSMNCSGGTINLDGFNRSFSGGFTISSGTISINSGNTISFSTASSMSGGTISGVLSSSSAFSITSSATEISPAVLSCNDSTNGNNSLSGTVTVNGCVDLVTPNGINTSTTNRGMVLGTGTITVSNTGIIRTKRGVSSLQEGRARYTNLTLQGGSKIKLGMAA